MSRDSRSEEFFRQRNWEEGGGLVASEIVHGVALPPERIVALTNGSWTVDISHAKMASDAIQRE
jgi:hypothetical protein